MTGVLVALVVLLAIAVAWLTATHLQYRRRRPSKLTTDGAKRILFPFIGDGLSQQALDAALRLAKAEDATLVPVFLARVSLHLPIDTPLPRQTGIALSLQEAIEQRATAWGIPVDARIDRGRSYRHALRETIEHERYDRIVLAAAARGRNGFDAGDVAWLLDHAAGEIVVLRPAHDTTISPPAPRGGARGPASPPNRRPRPRGAPRSPASKRSPAAPASRGSSASAGP